MNKEYGSFDFNYTGATVICDSKLKQNALQRFCSRVSQNYYVNPEKVTDEEKKDIYLYNSAYFHEARHVHEHLQSPLLNYLYRLRLFSSYHALQSSFISTKSNEFNLLPLPFYKWISLSEERKKDNIDNWRELMELDDITVPKFIMPTDSSSDLFDAITNRLKRNVSNNMASDLLVLSALYFDKFKEITKPIYDKYGSEYSIKTLIEASAFVHQMTAISIMNGKDGINYANSVIENTFNKALSLPDETRKTAFTDYTSIFTFIYRRLFHSKHRMHYSDPNFYPIVSYIINWCLSGNLLNVNAIANPLDRLWHFSEDDWINDISLVDLFEDPISVFSYFDRKMGSTPIDYSEFSKENNLGYERLINGIRNLDGFGDSFAEYIESIALASEMTIKAFIKEPSKFLMPELYLNNIYDYVNVPVHFYCTQSLMIPQKDLDEFIKVSDQEGNSQLDKGLIELKHISIDQPLFSVNPVKFYIPKIRDYHNPILGHSISDKAKPYCYLTDALFSEEFNSEIGEEILKIAFDGVNIGYIL